jgi:hypothetical protein
MLSPERSCNVIISCFILHNISRKYNFFGLQINELEVNDNIEIENSLVDNIEATDLRNNLVIKLYKRIIGSKFAKVLISTSVTFYSLMDLL